MRGLLDSWPERRIAGLPAADVILAAVLAAIAIASAVAEQPAEGPRWVTVPVAAVMTAALAGRGRVPTATAFVVVGAAGLQALVSTSPGSLWAFAVFLVVTYSVAVHSSEGRAALGGAVVIGGLFLQERLDNGVDYVFIVLVFGGAWLLGRAVRTWRDRAAMAEVQGADKARLAVAEERMRIARELHDVVAHALSVIAVQADAAEAALDHDPELARAPLTAVLTSARAGLDEMRQMLGVLRSDDDTAPRQPQPGLADLDSLVAGFRRAGLPVQVRLSDRATPLPPMIDLAAYRIVQEGLTNTLKHSGKAPTSVVVDRIGDVVSIQVTNEQGTTAKPAAHNGTGHGLIGIRERTLAVGGHLSAGRDETGGFRLTATLPVAKELA